MRGSISLPADCTIDNAKLFDHSTNLASPTTSGGYKKYQINNGNNLSTLNFVA